MVYYNALALIAKVIESIQSRVGFRGEKDYYEKEVHRRDFRILF